MRHSKLAYNHYTRDVNPKILIIFRQQLRFRDPFVADNVKEAQKPSDRVEFSLTNLGETRRLFRTIYSGTNKTCASS